MINLIIQNSYNALTLKVILNFRRLLRNRFYSLSNVLLKGENDSKSENRLKFWPIKRKINCNFATYNEYLIGLI